MMMMMMAIILLFQARLTHILSAKFLFVSSTYIDRHVSYVGIYNENTVIRLERLNLLAKNGVSESRPQLI